MNRVLRLLKLFHCISRLNDFHMFTDMYSIDMCVCLCNGVEISAVNGSMCLSVVGGAVVYSIGYILHYYVPLSTSEKNGETEREFSGRLDCINSPLNSLEKLH